MWKHLHDRITSLRGDVWAPKTSLALAIFVELPVPNQDSERSCMCTLGASLLSHSTGFCNCSDSMVFIVFIVLHHYFYYIMDVGPLVDEGHILQDIQIYRIHQSLTVIKFLTPMMANSGYIGKYNCDRTIHGYFVMYRCIIYEENNAL